MLQQIKWTSLLAAVLLFAGCASQRNEDGQPIDVAADELYDAVPLGETQRCINTRRIRRMEMVGNHTLLFHAHGGDVWRNRLARPCPGINRFSKFMYETRSGRLCQLDTVYELRDEGFGYRRGTACPLGEFDLLTAEQAEIVREMR